MMAWYVGVSPCEHHTTYIMAVGMLLIVIGSTSLLKQLLDPTYLMGASAYLISGLLVTITSSRSLQLRVFQALPKILRDILFEKSIIQLLQDDSRLTQLTGLFLACILLPKEKQPALLSDLPSSLDYCKQTAYGLSCPLRSSELTEQPIQKEASDRLIMKVADGDCSFVQRALTESAKHITQQAMLQSYKATENMMVSIRRQVVAMVSEWAPLTVSLISGGSLYYWLLSRSDGRKRIQDHLLRYIFDLQKFGKSFLKRQALLSSFPDDAFLSMNLLMADPSPLILPVLLGGAAVAVGAGALHFTDMTKQEQSGATTELARKEMQDFHVRSAIAAQPVTEKARCAVFGLLIAVEIASCLKPAHRATRSLLQTYISNADRPQCPRNADSIVPHAADIVVSCSLRSPVATSKQDPSCNTAAIDRQLWCVCLALVCALALRLRVPVHRLRWLLPLLHLRLGRVLSSR